MISEKIECKGCHRLNQADVIFCFYCRRKIRSGGVTMTVPQEVIAVGPTKQSWWKRILH